MEPMAAHPLHEPYGLCEAMDFNDNPPYLIREAHDSEPLNTFGKDNPYQTDPNWITHGYGALFREVSDGYSSQSYASGAVSAIVHEASFEDNHDTFQHPQHPATLSDRSGQSFPTGTKLESSNHPSHILKFLQRGDGGEATCLWMSGGGTCGFSSQIDLVKRHIKRMHYCLK